VSIHGTCKQVQSLSVRNRELISASSTSNYGAGRFSHEGDRRTAHSWLSTSGLSPEDHPQVVNPSRSK
jgi:hypothetical protein